MKITDQKVGNVVRILGKASGGLTTSEILTDYVRVHPGARSFRTLWTLTPSIRLHEVKQIIVFLTSKEVRLCEEDLRRSTSKRSVRYVLTQSGIQYLSTLKAR